MGLLEGKVSIITGGTSGIGASAARLFAAEGATVVIAGRRHVEGKRLASEIGPRARFVRADVSVESDVQALVDHVVDRFGRLDCLVNNAGAGGASGGVAALDMDRFWRTLAVDLGGVVLGMKHAAPVMVRQESGSIVNWPASAGGWRDGRCWTTPRPRPRCCS